jgi:hypothetical protein
MVQIHLPVTTLQLDGRDTRSRIWLARRAPYSLLPSHDARVDLPEPIGESRDSPSVAESARGRRTLAACWVTMGWVW